MSDGKDDLPSDREDGGLKPKPKQDNDSSTRPPDDRKVEQDPSEQPS